LSSAFRDFLRCGFLAGGFARFRCGDYGLDRLVAFSCKGRAVCPSCGGRRMAERRHLSGVAGRKNVVWVSEVFPIPTGEGRLEFLEEMRKTTRALNDAQASLYPVDARGLVGAITYSAGRPRFTTFSQIRGNMDTMEVVAEDTGGGNTSEGA
jgi:hypothetical protein